MTGRRTIFAFAIAALAAAHPAMAQVTVAPSESVAGRLLAAHNAERVRLGLKPLAWSAKLAEHAKKWAQALAVSDMMEHSTAAADGGEGENLWFGTKGDYAPEEMVGYFVDEAKLFKRGVFPNVSTSGRWEDVGHYTQLIWSDTREVGCALASNARRDVLVCRYTPVGNIEGRTVYNYAAPLPKPVAVAEPAAAGPANVSPSKPKKRGGKKRRRGG
ncbi:MAG: CAP domain-containing protein [Novosphingobium sp.]|uniref:CAP domain-containing protein n=1 Tax=Novosphingobium sp. TaxID=1874826 RepID=UPI0030163547